MTFYTDGPLLEPERQTIQEVRQIRRQEAARQIAELVRVEKRLAAAGAGSASDDTNVVPSDGDIVYGDIAMRSAVRLVPLVSDGDYEPDGWGVV